MKFFLIFFQFFFYKLEMDFYNLIQMVQFVNLLFPDISVDRI